MHKALQNESAKIVVEGANALMLDIDFGELFTFLLKNLQRIPFFKIINDWYKCDDYTCCLAELPYLF